MSGIFARYVAGLVAVWAALAGAAIAAGSALPSRQLATSAGHWGRHTLYLVDAGRRLSVPLAYHSASISSPVWSPSGQEIAYFTFGAEQHTLYVLSVSNRREVYRLHDLPGYSALPAWSPDGQMLALTSNRDQGLFYLYTLSPYLRAMNRVTAASAIDLTPAWSADGQTILFSAWRRGGQTIQAVSRTGGEEQTLFPNLNGTTQIAWSPDRTRIVFTVNYSPNADTELYLVDVADGGATPRQLTSNSYYDSYPVWSPDGREIAFFSLREDGQNIYIISLEDGSERQVTHAGLRNPSGVEWSPDGQWLIFTASENMQQSVFQVRADGSGLRHVVTGIVAGSRAAWRP